jgi:hypothetical protein
MQIARVKLEPSQVAAIMGTYQQLAARWREVPIGEHLELEMRL